MRSPAVAPCAEFPNDNADLHLGAIWACLEVTGPASCERRELAEIRPETPEPLPVPSPPSVEVATDPAPPVLDAEDDTDDIEIVDEIVLDDVVDESPPPQAPVATDDPFAALGQVLESVARDAGASESALLVLRTLVGRERLGDDAPPEHAALRAQAAGWQAILKGDSEDFSIVGASPLDEWSSIVVAQALGQPARADGLRRELRRRGVAAFGLVIEAA